MTTKLKEERRRFEEVHFTLTSDSIKLSGQLNNSSQDWDIERRGSGEVRDLDDYSMVCCSPQHLTPMSGGEAYTKKLCTCCVPVSSAQPLFRGVPKLQP